MALTSKPHKPSLAQIAEWLDESHYDDWREGYREVFVDEEGNLVVSFESAIVMGQESGEGAWSGFEMKFKPIEES